MPANVSRAIPSPTTSCSPPSIAPSAPSPRPAWPVGIAGLSSLACCPCPPATSPATPAPTHRFGTHRAYREPQALDRPEEDLSRRLVDRYGLTPQPPSFDPTNSDPFIAAQTRARLPQRGHAKSKRTDLRVVGLALM